MTLIQWKISNSPNPENVHTYAMNIKKDGTYTLDLIHHKKIFILPENHHHEVCMGNCKKHPLMSLELRKMFNGSMQWGDLLC